MGFMLPHHEKARYYLLNTSPLIIPIALLPILFYMFDMSEPLFLILSILFLGIPLGVITYIFLFFVINRSIVFRTNYQIKSLCEEENYDKCIKLLENRSNYGLGDIVEVNLKATKAMVLLKKGSYKKSEEILNYLLNDYPNFLTALYYKACLESDRGNLNEVKRLLEKMEKTYENIIKNKKSPLSKFVYKKKKKKFLEKINEDEDLQPINAIQF